MNGAAEAALAGELEGNAKVPRQPGSAVADNDRVDERVKFVDEVRGHHRRREVRTTDDEVAFARRLEPTNLVGIEGAFDARARGRGTRQRRREHDLVRGPPHRGEIALELE